MPLNCYLYCTSHFIAKNVIKQQLAGGRTPRSWNLLERKHTNANNNLLSVGYIVISGTEKKNYHNGNFSA